MKLVSEPSPHVHGKGSTRWIMAMVVMALIPTLAASVAIFGIQSLIVTLTCVVSAIVCEAACCAVMRRKSSVTDLSCIVTGMLLAFTLPASCPLWAAALGAAFAVVVVKMLFGGIGCNFANPAVAGRVFLMVALPMALSSYPNPVSQQVDAVTGATPLAQAAATGSMNVGYLDLFLGNHAGALGETCIVTLLMGFVFLLAVGVADGWAALPFVATVAAVTALAGEDPLAQVLSGGLALGAFFMATDYTTTPMTAKGKVIFGIGCGLITALVRLFAAAPEGVAFSILFMNMFTPLIDRYVRPRVSGGVKHAL